MDTILSTHSLHHQIEQSKSLLLLLQLQQQLEATSQLLNTSIPNNGDPNQSYPGPDNTNHSQPVITKPYSLSHQPTHHNILKNASHAGYNLNSNSNLAKQNFNTNSSVSFKAPLISNFDSGNSKFEANSNFTQNRASQSIHNLGNHLKKNQSFSQNQNLNAASGLNTSSVNPQICTKSKSGKNLNFNSSPAGPPRSWSTNNRDSLLKLANHLTNIALSESYHNFDDSLGVNDPKLNAGNFNCKHCNNFSTQLSQSQKELIQNLINSIQNGPSINYYNSCNFCQGKCYHLLGWVLQ